MEWTLLALKYQLLFKSLVFSLEFKCSLKRVIAGLSPIESHYRVPVEKTTKIESYWKLWLKRSDILLSTYQVYWLNRLIHAGQVDATGENCTGVRVYLYVLYTDFNKRISIYVIHRISIMHLEREKGFGHWLYKICNWHVCLLLIFQMKHIIHMRERERERERERDL